MSDLSPRFRPVLDTFPAYKPGKAPVAAAGEAHKLSSNESPYGPLPSVIEVIAEAGGSVNRYPDNGAEALIGALAERFAVPAGHVAVGCGSVGVLKQLIEAVSDPGSQVLYAWRSFEAYPMLADLAGVTSVRVPLRQATHDLAAMAAAITPRTRMVLVCTPNNPTGTTVGDAELEVFLESVPPHVLVVIDEAYLEFVTAPDSPDALAIHRSRPNVAVLRTFSKAYGLAGLRVGYAVAHEPLAEALRKAAIPFGVNSLAQVAAVASLEAFDELEVRVKELVAERARVVEALTAQGWVLPDAQANFVWFGLGELTAEFAAACEAAGLTVRPYGSDGARATIGEREANDRLIEVAGAFRAAHPTA
jgi:histidinol-phosphate aminotransferase